MQAEQQLQPRVARLNPCLILNPNLTLNPPPLPLNLNDPRSTLGSFSETFVVFADHFAVRHPEALGYTVLLFHQPDHVDSYHVRVVAAIEDVICRDPPSLSRLTALFFAAHP